MCKMRKKYFVIVLTIYIKKGIKCVFSGKLESKKSRDMS